MSEQIDERVVLDRDVCQKCGREVVQVDLTGSPFFTHKPRRDCLTWWHVDQRRNLTHQAVPTLRAAQVAPSRGSGAGGGE